MPRFFFFFNYLTKKKMTSVGASRRAADSGFVGVLVLVEQVKLVWEMDKKPPRLTCFWRSGRTNNCSHVQTHRGQTLSQKRHNFSHMEAKRPQIQQCFHHWAIDVLVWYVREKRPSTSAFFFSSSRQLLRFDFNAFCVVLYFHAKILLYLNVFILLNVFIFLVIIP